MIEKDIAQLEGMDLNALREMWKEYFHTEAISLNRKYYVYRIAYRMQEMLYGGVPETIKETLLNTKLSKDKHCSSKIPIPGTKLVKRYKGHEYSCTVLRNGFEYNGRFYKTLSAVAQEITDLKISGIFFFDLMKGKTKNG